MVNKIKLEIWLVIIAAMGMLAVVVYFIVNSYNALLQDTSSGVSNVGGSAGSAIYNFFANLFGQSQADE